MKRLIFLAAALAVAGFLLAPIFESIASTRDLESKVMSAVGKSSLKELPEELNFRVPGTEWFFAGFLCPYDHRTYSLNPVTGLSGNFDLALESESRNALFFLNAARETTYVEVKRSDLDLCASDSVKPIIPVID